MIRPAGDLTHPEGRRLQEAITMPGVDAISYRTVPAEWGADFRKKKSLWLGRREDVRTLEGCKLEVHPLTKEHTEPFGKTTVYDNNTPTAFGIMSDAEIAYRKRLSAQSDKELQAERDGRFGAGACDFAVDL